MEESSFTTNFNMTLLKNKFILAPFLALILAFILDKVLLSENIQTYFSKTMSEINYSQKEELYDELKAYLKEENHRKVLVYFGTSRALLFENAYIESEFKDWTLFNFSVPGGTPDYTLYWLERFQEDKVKPNFVLLDQSVEAYNSAAVISLDDVLTNGLSVSFVLRHSKNYSSSEISTLLAKRMFKTYHYRPKMATVLARVKDDFAILKSYRELRAGLKKSLKDGKGSAMTPGTSSGIMPDEMLKKSSWGDFHSYMVPYHFKDQPMYFLGLSYKILDEMNIPKAAIWVRLSRPYYTLIQNELVTTKSKEKSTVYNLWFPTISKFQKEHKVDLWNMNDDPNYNCDLFLDSGHMSPACYKDYTNYIFNQLKKSGN